MNEDSVHEEKKQQIVHIAQERSDHEGFEDEQITESLQERPRQARLNAGSSDFKPSQTQKRRQRKRKSQKSKPKRQISQTSQKINAEANQDGDQDANRTDRDSKYLHVLYN